MFKKIMSLFIMISLVMGTISVFAMDVNSNNVDEQVVTVSSSYDIAYGGSDIEMDKMFDEIIVKIREYKKNNPKASDKKLDEYTEKLLNGAVKKNNSKKSSTESGEVTVAYYNDMNGYITGHLNSQEQALYNSNKTKALLCMANGKLAIDYAEKNYITSVLHNGNGDAFRHCLCNYGMAIDVGQDFAKKWGDAHEYGAVGQPLIERNMDLFNNAVGLQLAKDNPWTIWHSTFISKSKEKCRNGELRIISNNVLVKSSSVGEK